MSTLDFTFILLLACLPFLGADLYVPSIVAMARYFDTSVDIIQLSLSALMFGIAVSQFVYGPISEGVGRRPTILLGLLLSMLGCLICIYTHSLTLFFIGMVTQGLGLGAGSLARCILRDMSTSDQLLTLGGQIALLNTFILTSAPLLGGYLQQTFDWQACFVFFLIYNLVVWLITLLHYAESNAYHHIERLDLAYVFRIYRIILSHKAFSGYCLCTFLCMFGYFAWITVCPVLMIRNLGYSEFALGQAIMLTSFCAFISGGMLNNFLITRVQVKYVFHSGWIIMLLAGLGLFFGYLIYGLSATLLLSSMLVFIFGSALLWPNFFAHAFAPFHETAGYAGALYGCTQISGAAVSAFVVSILPETSPLPLAAVLLVTSLLGLLYYRNIIIPFEEASLDKIENPDE